MTAIERTALDVTGPVAPQRKRAARLGIPMLERAAAAPQHEEWTGNAPSGPPVRLIMGAVEGRGRAIFLADGMSAIAQGLDIGGAYVRTKRRGRRAPRPSWRTVRP